METIEEIYNATIDYIRTFGIDKYIPTLFLFKGDEIKGIILPLTKQAFYRVVPEIIENSKPDAIMLLFEARITAIDGVRDGLFGIYVDKEKELVRMTFFRELETGKVEVTNDTGFITINENVTYTGLLKDLIETIKPVLRKH